MRTTGYLLNVTDLSMSPRTPFCSSVRYFDSLGDCEPSGMAPRDI